MGLNNVLVLSQVTTYIIAFLLSLCIIIPISYHLSDFRGHCLLFSRGNWSETDGQLEVSWGSQAFCDYNISWASISLLIALIQSYKCIVQLCTGGESTFLSAFVDVVVSVVMSFAALAGALIITIGYQIWCNTIMLRFEACEDATQNDIDRKDEIHTRMFYTHFGTAQFGAWTLWVCWVGLAMFSWLKLWKYHQQENIRVSMARERARLVRDRHVRLTD
ncbi:transmembrane protein 179-like [Penaeus chinensis]|uniref:transmembrane protein 179-like n=1 Tax=Penaeus chinensis TaxID=139456 RepID=UPI001FB6D800|nr:transmembrane protein 179-like [Penaeus chinensis]